MSRQFFLAIAFSLAVFLKANAQGAVDFDAAPINYSTGKAENAISQLNDRLKSNKTRLRFDEQNGYLASVLEELKVPVSSQVLAFSQTSKQSERIRPKTPRALYFSDDVYVGFVNRHAVNDESAHSNSLLEFAVSDPNLGIVFYTLEQEKTAIPQFVRQSGECLGCHNGLRTQGVPGLQVRSVIPDYEGTPILSAGQLKSTHATPLAKRWGGWYVTGQHGDQTHLGNYISPTTRKPKIIDNTFGLNVTDVSKKFDTNTYLSPHSDLVALMVLEHQSDAANFISLANYMHQLHRDGKADDTKLNLAINLLVKHFLFTNEAKLTHPVKGTSRFQGEFEKLGPTDKSGRSLRQFDLQSRLFKVPLSYMIYSQGFVTLPSDLKMLIFKRLWEIVSSEEVGKEYPHLSAQDKSSIRDIVKSTVPNLPNCWQ